MLQGKRNVVSSLILPLIVERVYIGLNFQLSLNPKFLTVGFNVRPLLIFTDTKIMVYISVPISI